MLTNTRRNCNVSKELKLQVKEQRIQKKKKGLAQAIELYQSIYKSNKKVRTNMELLVTLAMKFWMWTILIALIIIGFIINLFDKKSKMLYI